MSVGKKLELTWVGKGKEYNLEPRILLYDADKSYGDENTENMLIHGDNLLALKALEQEYSGKVKCIYIDPPYNTGNAFEHYDDGLEHSIWLELMYERLTILRNLLSEDGAIFIHLDDSESDYCKVIMDEIFGRKNYMNRITIDARSPSAFSTVNPGMFVSSEYILYYAKSRASVTEKNIRVSRRPDEAYNLIITNYKSNFEDWKIVSLPQYFKGNFPNAFHGTPLSIVSKYDKFIIENSERIVRYTEISDTGAGAETVRLKRQSLSEKDKIFKLLRSKYDDIYILNGKQISFYSKNIHEIDGKKSATKMLTDIWDDISWEGIAKEGTVKFKKSKKPERLIHRILTLASNKGDLVLDSFLGSGTTAAVAHKMNRKYIGIELGNHCYTHAKVRLDKVIDGEQGGISKSVGWSGGVGINSMNLRLHCSKKTIITNGLSIRKNITPTCSRQLWQNFMDINITRIQ